MRLLYTSDIHAGPNLLAQLVNVALSNRLDAVIIGGDLIPHHLPIHSGQDIIHAQAAYLETVFMPAFQTLKSQAHIPVYLDMGNDDFAINRSMLKAYDGDLFHLIHMQCLGLTKTVDLIGYMVVPPTPFQRKDWEKPDTRDCPVRSGNQVITQGRITWNGVVEEIELDLQSEDTIEADLAKLSSRIQKPFIFISHSPPSDTPLDITGLGIHVGSLAIRNFIAHWAGQGMLLAALHGHIHESFNMSGTIRTTINGALCINPGQNHGPEASLRYVILELKDNDAAPVIRLADSAD